MGSKNSSEKTSSSSPVQHLEPTKNTLIDKKTEELPRGKMIPGKLLILSRKMNEKDMRKHLVQRVESRGLKVVGVW